MGDEWKNLKDQIVASVEARAKDFLAKNAPVKELIAERAERLAKLFVQYKLAADDAAKKLLEEDMAVVKQTMENDLAGLLVAASVEARATLKAAASAVFDFAIKMLPTIIKVL